MLTDDRLSQAEYDSETHDDDTAPYPVPLAKSNPGLSLPGCAIAPYEDCGQPILRVCERDYDAHLPKVHARICYRNCGRVGCPVCWPSAIRETARRNTVRFVAMISRLKAPLHVVFSPPQGYFEDGTSPKVVIMRSRDLAKEVGLSGGRDMFHLNRGHNEEQFHEAPHVQGLYVGSVDGQKVKAVYERTGWVIRVLGSPGHYRRNTQKEIFDTLNYELGHAILKGTRQLGGFWGLMSPHSIKATLSTLEYESMRSEEKTRPETVCPHCGGVMIAKKWTRAPGVFDPHPPPWDRDIEIPYEDCYADKWSEYAL